MTKREKLLLLALFLILFLKISAGKLPCNLNLWFFGGAFLLCFLWILKLTSQQIILLALGVLMAAVWPLWLKNEMLAEQMGNLAYFLLFIGVIGETKGIWGPPAGGLEKL